MSVPIYGSLLTNARARLRGTYDRDGRKTISRIILAGLVLLVVWTPTAYSLEVELPKVALRDVATEVVVRDVEVGQSVRLTIGSYIGHDNAVVHGFGL
ncbi:MAG: hypothetical protein OSB26_14155 [Woeseiaceae bacterium]|nr:hypothetical protein [Woeseiaceae bacterium]